jgi:hypothetical protein
MCCLLGLRGELLSWAAHFINTTNEGQQNEAGVYSPRAGVLAVVASEGDKCMNTAHTPNRSRNSAPLI